MTEMEKQATVPYFVHEGQMARMERVIKILAGLLVTAIVLFILNNVVWMKYTDRQVERVRQEVVADAGIHEQSNPGDHP